MNHWKFFLNNNKAPHPIGMLVDTVPVPPLCIRPTVKITDEKNNEDDMTIKLFEMIKQKKSISKPIESI
jgi:DNA-directed RNA polymerase III subunit RPC1